MIKSNTMVEITFEEMLNKKEQLKTIDKHTTGAGIFAEFTCPSCSTSQPVPQIENEGENWTQVHCKYGCGYIEIN